MRVIYEEIDNGWLDEVDGMTVAQIIEYLSKFNPDDKLTFDLDGDTHGVDVESKVMRPRAETEQEANIRQAKEKEALISRAQQTVDYYTNCVNTSPNHMWKQEYQERLNIAIKYLEKCKNL